MLDARGRGTYLLGKGQSVLTMSRLYKSDEEVDELLNHQNNSIPPKTVEVKIIGSGNHGNHDKGNKKNGNGEQVRGPEAQSQIGTLAHLVGNKAASALTGVGETQVSQHKNGKNSNNKVVTELVEESESRLDSLGNLAVDKVEMFLELLDEDKMLELKAKDIPAAASKMMDIADKIKRRNQVHVDEVRASRPQIHFYAPVQMKVDQYLTKEV